MTGIAWKSLSLSLSVCRESVCVCVCVCVCMCVCVCVEVVDWDRLGLPPGSPDDDVCYYICWRLELEGETELLYLLETRARGGDGSPSSIKRARNAPESVETRE